MSAPASGVSSYRRDMIGIVVLAAFVFCIGSLASGSYLKTMLIFSMIYGIAAIGLCLVFGYGGQISLCQGAMFGLGAYTCAALVQRWRVDHLLALGASIALPALVGWLVARPLGRLSSHYLAMATLALGLILSILFAQVRTITGGADPGVIDLASFAPFGMPLGTTSSMHWVCGVCLVVVMVLAVNLINTRIGRALRAIRSGEVPAACLGIDTSKYKVDVFAAASGLAGLGGGLYAFATRTFNSSAFEIGFSIDLLTMVLIGSVRSPWGAMAGALVITVLPAFLEHLDRFRLLSFGLLMTGVMVFMPDGLTSAAYAGARRLVKRAQ